MTKNEAEMKCVWDSVLVAVWLLWGLDVGTFGAWEDEKGRTGKTVKMSTAPRRDAQLRGLKGFKICQKTTKHRIWDTPLLRHNLRFKFGCN